MPSYRPATHVRRMCPHGIKEMEMEWTGWKACPLKEPESMEPGPTVAERLTFAATAGGTGNALSFNFTAGPGRTLEKRHHRGWRSAGGSSGHSQHALPSLPRLFARVPRFLPTQWPEGLVSNGHGSLGIPESWDVSTTFRPPPRTGAKSMCRIPVSQRLEAARRECVSARAIAGQRFSRESSR